MRGGCIIRDDQIRRKMRFRNYCDEKFCNKFKDFCLQ